MDFKLELPSNELSRFNSAIKRWMALYFDIHATI